MATQAATQRGLGKITDYVAQKFDGTTPSEFPAFVRAFDLGVETLEVHPTKQYLLFLNCLADRPNEVAQEFVKKYREDHPETTTGTRGHGRGHGCRGS